MKTAGTKTCTDCLKTKDVGQFSIEAKASDGLRGKCKRCDAVNWRRRALTPHTKYTSGETAGSVFYEGPSIGFPSFP